MIQHYLKLNPNLIWYIENPRGMMRKMPCMQNLIRHTVTYCQYGDKLVYNLIFNMDNKKCPKCGKIKDIGEFYKNKCRRDGFTSYCKDCISIDSSDYHSRNKEKCKERLQEWREKNREYVRERDIKYRTDNPEIEFNKQKRYRENHINELYLKGKKYREEHSDYFYNKARERKLSQKEVSDGSITLEFEKYLFDSQNGKCGYCGCSLEESGKHLDHIYPLSKG